MAARNSVALLDLTSDSKTLERGTKEWNLTSQSVRKALETHGCMLVEYNKISGEDREEMLNAMRGLFSLPTEKKKQQPRISGYNIVLMDETGAIPVYENVGADNSAQLHEAEAFTAHMWADGNQAFCRTLNEMSKKMLDLGKILMDMICDSFGLQSDTRSPFQDDTTSLQMIRYAPLNKAFSGVRQHVDGNLLTICFQNEVDGVFAKSRQGDWCELKPRGNSLVVFAGQALKAWSNGLLYAAPHKVECSGDKERLSCCLFAKPRDDQIIQAPPEFLNEQHPVLFKPFVFADFIKYYKEIGAGEDALDLYMAMLEA